MASLAREATTVATIAVVTITIITTAAATIISTIISAVVFVSNGIYDMCEARVINDDASINIPV